MPRDSATGNGVKVLRFGTTERDERIHRKRINDGGILRVQRCNNERIRVVEMGDRRKEIKMEPTDNCERIG